MKAGDVLFLDTNVLLTATEVGRESHGSARSLVETSERSGIHLAVSGQIFREYLVVATRAADRNGLGLAVRDALNNVREFTKVTIFYDESRSVHQALLGLLATNDVTGKRIHDANVAATMIAHGLRFLATENVGDFASFKDLEPFTITEAVGRLQS